jgi:hypothetical protein
MNMELNPAHHVVSVNDAPMFIQKAGSNLYLKWPRYPRLLIHGRLPPFNPRICIWQSV